MCYRSAALIGLVSTIALTLTAGATKLIFVPWKIVAPDTPAANHSLVLYWVPASPEELRRSELITSRPLSVYASKCVGMHVVRADDTARIERFGVEGLLPIVLLIDGDEEVARVEHDRGTLDASEVEKMVRVAFDEREAAAITMLSEANRLASSGATAQAIVLYERVTAQRCAFPRLAKQAQRALRKLGVR